MDLGFIDSTQGIPMQGNGIMDRAMGLEYKPALMAVVMWASSSVAPSTALAVTILGELFNSTFELPLLLFDFDFSFDLFLSINC